MNRNSFLITLVLLAVAVPGAFAQSVPAHLDLSQMYHFEGAVASIQSAPGAGTPLFVLRTADGSEVPIQTGPYWFFQTSGFILAEGDAVAVDAFASLDPASTLYYAARIVLLATGTELVLRGEDGVPAWTGGRHNGSRQGSGDGTSDGHGSDNDSGHNGDSNGSGDGVCDGSGRGGSRGNGQGDAANGPGNPGRSGIGGLDLENAQVITGTVTASALALGRRDSFLTVTDASGTAFDIRIGPFWYLALNGFSVSLGDSVEATVASPPAAPERLVALELHNLTTGAVIVLRDDAGFPLWRH